MLRCRPESMRRYGKPTAPPCNSLINNKKITMTDDITFKDLGIESQWCYNTSCFMKNKEEMQKGLLEILSGEYKPSIAI